MTKRSPDAATPPVIHWADRIRFPDRDRIVDQHEEQVEILVDGHWAPVRMHDYGAIYQRPGLYEALFRERLACDSPRRVVRLLDEVRNDLGTGALRVLDLGAGNGLVGEALTEIGADAIYGIDILPAAKAAAERDRPGLYHDYLVTDVADLAEPDSRMLQAANLNCLTCVAALGFGDIPHGAFAAAVDLVEDGGLLAFNIKETFLDERYTFGFSKLIRDALRTGLLRLEASRRYRHRVSAQGIALYYIAMVATKLGSVRDLRA